MPALRLRLILGVRRLHAQFLDQKRLAVAASSIILVVGLPAPWPALVSMRIRIGAVPAWAACSVAANLKLWAGTTRSSWSAVVMSVAGYCVPGLMLCSGE